jgi:hypothetical protein
LIPQTSDKHRFDDPVGFRRLDPGRLSFGREFTARAEHICAPGPPELGDSGFSAHLEGARDTRIDHERLIYLSIYRCYERSPSGRAKRVEVGRKPSKSPKEGCRDRRTIAFSRQIRRRLSWIAAACRPA